MMLSNSITSAISAGSAARQPGPGRIARLCVVGAHANRAHRAPRATIAAVWGDGVAPRRRLVAARATAESASAAALTDELRVLETERDDAVKTAESCARTSVRLEEMVQLLDKLALEKMKDGDEDGARQVLAEKASTRDILERTNARAQVNYALASKLAEKIGLVQRRLVDVLSPAGVGPQQQQQQERPAVDPAAAGTTAGAYASPCAGAGAAPRGAPRKLAWEESREAARARILAAKEAAAATGRRASWQARETIEEARERLRQQAVSSVVEAQQRVRAKANESIAEARVRIAAEDAAVLAKVQALMARYRRGEYVSEDELEWAFRQLERRFVV